MPKAIVTDIEGTTSSIAFVKDVLFPYAAERLPSWLRENRNVPAVQAEIEKVAEAIDRTTSDLEAVIEQLLDWINQDVKATPLKALQGMLWKSGYESGHYRAHVYPDAHAALQDWNAQGTPLYVYSSGSVQAQQLFFQYSDFGDLRSLFSGYFDTTTGPKSERASYLKLAADVGLPAADILFLSDVEAETAAALAAGMQAVLIVRGEDSDVDSDEVSCRSARDFHEVLEVISGHLT
ncbi:MAG: acireductone synthase [Pseudomonadota bacterium]